MGRHGTLKPSRSELIFPLVLGPICLVAFVVTAMTSNVPAMTPPLVFTIICVMKLVNFAIRNHQANRDVRP